ncbi:Bug family tripartite tricarboxylate transporter substrate binding protein [Undibacter mobilis]|uniref:Tripartite tricarboxylate transporter substrate binding protein n=1 Tax=Undibacter mobilis TaxID=2292256 RepID=A0A371B6S2_9BRAD|nr:tripartite tricarboxylate transporter substrate binding protein [Undibacter mobilis]RDV03296.1 tripartite tricarboxylate transporter substrate binding protein [Undibacter mobilis]
MSGNLISSSPMSGKPSSSKPMRVGPALRWLVTAVAAAIVWLPQPGVAQEWPSRTVTLTQTFAGGGMMDFAIRAIAQAMTETFGQTFVVETKQGGGGVVGLVATAKAPPDGYHFVVTAIGPMVFRPLVEKTIGFDPDKDFEPVILIGATPNGVLAAPKLGVSTIAELKTWAARNGNKLNIGMPGIGTMGQYCGVLLLQKLGIEGNFINYRGGTPIVQDLLGGQIELGTPAFGPSAMSTKVLAIAADKRLDAVPAVPTLKEAGVDITCATWNAIFAPRGTPKAIVVKLNAAIDAYLQKPETQKAFNDIGMTPWGGTPERVTAQMADDRKTWGDIVIRLEAANPK